MLKQCEIKLNGETIGTASIRKEGLYYHFDCRCRFSDKKFHRLTAVCGELSADLGICVPSGNDFVVKTKVAVSRLGIGQINIEADRSDKRPKQTVVSVTENGAFSNLEDLDKAVLCNEGITFTQKAQDPQDSDQNP